MVICPGTPLRPPMTGRPAVGSNGGLHDAHLGLALSSRLAPAGDMATDARGTTPLGWLFPATRGDHFGGAGAGEARLLVRCAPGALAEAGCAPLAATLADTTDSARTAAASWRASALWLEICTPLLGSKGHRSSSPTLPSDPRSRAPIEASLGQMSYAAALVSRIRHGPRGGERSVGPREGLSAWSM